MNKLLLKLVMLPASLWASTGADTAQLRAILHARLLTDDRKPLAFGRQRRKKKMRHASLLNVLLSMAMGFTLSLVLYTVSAPVIALTLYFTAVLSMLTYILLSDYAHALVDTKDRHILFPRPVNDRTILLSRSLYIFIYLLRTAIPLSVPGWVYIGLDYGTAAALLFPVAILGLLFISLFIVTGAYMLLLRFLNGRQFREMLNYLQIGLSVLMFGLFYLAPRATTSGLFDGVNWSRYGWLQAFPSYWLAALVGWSGLPAVFPHAGWMGLLALAAPLAMGLLTIRYLSPRFAGKLMEMDGDYEAPVRAARQKTARRSGMRLATVLNRHPEARAGFLVTWIQIARSRAFRLKTYPAFAYIPIYLLYILWQRGDDLGASLHALPQGKSYLMMLYMCSAIIMQGMTYVSVSEQYKAAWIYYAAPVDHPGYVLAGAFKAIWVKYFLPFFTAISLLVLWIWGLKVIPDILLALVNIFVFATCVLRINFRRLPFSHAEEPKNSGIRTVFRVFGVLFVIGTLGLLHWAFSWIPALKLVLALLSGGFAWLVWDSYIHTPWAVIKRIEEQD